MFVDALAMVAILAGEEEDTALFACLDAAVRPTTSAVAILEAASAICRKKRCSVNEAKAEVRRLLEQARIEFHPLTDGVAHGALVAYACARMQGVPLLFIGNDFSQTDIASALP